MWKASPLVWILVFCTLTFSHEHIWMPVAALVTIP